MAGNVGFGAQNEMATMAGQTLANSKMFQDAFQMMSFNNNFGPVFADMRAAGNAKQIAKMQAKASKPKKSFGGLGAGLGAAGSAIGAAALGAGPAGIMLDAGIGAAVGGGIGEQFGG